MSLIDREWNEYWNKKATFGGSLYDLMSGIYRKLIIKPAANHFVKKQFRPGQSLLHAGCGSGQTDTDINRAFEVTALDISPRALSLYRRFNRDNPRVILGDIFHVPFEDGSFDGAYNLGVMEHFSEEDIVRILSELSRVVKPNGKILLFWPPEFGLSVRFLKALGAFSERVLRRKVKFHPDEPTLVRSKEHIEMICAKADLKIIDYYFGCRDLFTQVAVVIGK